MRQSSCDDCFRIPHEAKGPRESGLGRAIGKGPRRAPALADFAEPGPATHRVSLCTALRAGCRENWQSRSTVTLVSLAWVVGAGISGVEAYCRSFCKQNACPQRICACDLSLVESKRWAARKQRQRKLKERRHKLIEFVQNVAAQGVHHCLHLSPQRTLP